MIELLLQLKAKVDENKIRLCQATLEKIEKRYHHILRKGFRANPPPDEEPHIKKRREKKKRKSLNLLSRFKTHSKETLAFAYNFNIPFDNNLAERNLRMMKV